MVATATQILHEQNFIAEKELELFFGEDGLVRINIDGVCALRVRVNKDCRLKIHYPDDESVYNTGKAQPVNDPELHELHDVWKGHGK